MQFYFDTCSCAFDYESDAEGIPVTGSCIRLCDAHTVEAPEVRERFLVVHAENTLRQKAFAFINGQSSLAKLSSDIRMADGSIKTVFIDELPVEQRALISLVGTAPVPKFRHQVVTFFDANRLLNIVCPALTLEEVATLQTEVNLAFGDNRITVLVALPEGQASIEDKALSNIAE